MVFSKVFILALSALASYTGCTCLFWDGIIKLDFKNSHNIIFLLRIFCCIKIKGNEML